MRFFASLRMTNRHILGFAGQALQASIMFLFLSALRDEIRPVLAKTTVKEKIHVKSAALVRGVYNGHDVILGYTGVGVDKMYDAATFAIDNFNPDILINVGYAGGLTPFLSSGDIIIATRLVHIQGPNDPTYEIDAELISIAEARCNEAGLKVHKGTVATSDSPILTAQEKLYIGTKFGVDAVEMEGIGLARAAKNTPFLVVRAVLDQLDTNLPDPLATTPWEAFKDVVKHPNDVISYTRLALLASRARDSIARFIEKWLESSS